MDNEAIHNTIRARFRNQVGNVLNLQVQYDNAPVNRVDGEPWLRLAIRQGDWQQQTMGSSRRFRNFGMAIASIFIPSNQGDRDALTIADQIVSAFRGVTDSGVRFLTPTVLPLGQIGNEWQVNVTIPFTADDIG